MTKAQELAETLQAKRLAVLGIIEEAGPDLDFSKVKTLGDSDAKGKLEAFQALNAELAGIEDEYQKARQFEDEVKEIQRKHAEANRPVNGLGNPYHTDPERDGTELVKTLGELIVESAYFKAYDPMNAGARAGGFVGLPLDGAKGERMIDTKTLMSTTSGIIPQPVRTSRVVEMNQPRLTVADLIPQVTVTDKTVTWLEETTHTNNADGVAEGVEKPESALGYEEKSETVKKIAHWIPVTTEQIQYVPSFMNIVNGRMVAMLKRKEEQKLLLSTGSSSQMQGFLTKSGVLTQARGADENVEAILKAFTKVRIGAAYAEPSAVVIHPTNWESIRLMRTDGGTGEFLWGSPAEAGVERVWGKPVVQTPEITLNTALTGDFQLYSEIARFGGIRFEVGYIDRQMVENRKTLLVEEFLMLEIFNAAAFATITGLN